MTGRARAHLGRLLALLERGVIELSGDGYGNHDGASLSLVFFLANSTSVLVTSFPFLSATMDTTKEVNANVRGKGSGIYREHPSTSR